MKVMIRDGKRICTLEAAEARAIERAANALRVFATESNNDLAKLAADAVWKFIEKQNE